MSTLDGINLSKKLSNKTRKYFLPVPSSFYTMKNDIHIYVDSSAYGVGAVLLHPDESNRDHSVCYACKSLNKAQCKYPTIERELLAVYFALRHFHPYIYGKEFKLYADNKPLVGMKFASNTTKISNRLTTWELFFQEHKFEILNTKARKIP